jgi:hypothetical protein
MKFTLIERKILQIATTSAAQNLENTYSPKLFKFFFIIGIIGGGIGLIDGLIGLASNQHDSLRSISFGLLCLGSIGSMYENLRFKDAIISLVNKLTSEQEIIMPASEYIDRKLKNSLNFVWFSLGSIGVAITLIYGIRGLVSKENDILGIRGGFRATIFVLLLISFLGLMFENLRFRHSAFSLLRKLKR